MKPNMQSGVLSIPALLFASLLLSIGGASFATVVKNYIRDHVQTSALASLDDVSPAPSQAPTPTPTPTLAPQPASKPVTVTKPSVSIRAGADEDSELETDD